MGRNQVQKMMKWRSVPGWEGFYEVSDAGLVRSVDRTIIAMQSNGKIGARFFKGRTLVASIRSHGYQAVDLSGLGRRETRCVHELVALAFIGPRPDGQVVRHLNDQRTENKASNLAYGTYADNSEDQRRNGCAPTQKKGAAHPWARFDAATAAAIKKRAQRHSYRTIARDYGTSHSVVSRIARGLYA